MAIRWQKNSQIPLDGMVNPSWGNPMTLLRQTGKSIALDVANTTASQIDALLKHKPAYLYSYPSQLATLAEYCISNNIKILSIQKIICTGESLSNTHKEVIKHAWPNAQIADVYSTEEVSTIAQQCEKENNYHINTENVYIEIVDENGKPCKPYETGKILVTSLVNYATPLIRYEIGDYAEVGKPCSCGINLPVLKKILGRKRNRLRLPTGESKFPYLGEREDFLKITQGKKARRFQLLQLSLKNLELKLVMDKPLSSTQENQFVTLLQKNLGYPFNISITYPENISVGPTGKFEEFVSLVG